MTWENGFNHNKFRGWKYRENSVAYGHAIFVAMVGIRKYVDNVPDQLSFRVKVS